MSGTSLEETSLIQLRLSQLPPHLSVFKQLCLSHVTYFRHEDLNIHRRLSLFARLYSSCCPHTAAQ
jgi:hypothetical protein